MKAQYHFAITAWCISKLLNKLAKFVMIFILLMHENQSIDTLII